jgi:hypothetical protein
VVNFFGNYVSCTLQPEPIEGSIPLTPKERTLKEQLEAVVERGIQQFLEVGLALSELRSKRLYRVTHPSFEAYIRDRFNLARSSVDQLIRSASTAQCLQEAGIQLPKGTTEAVIRPISSLPGEELQAACWQLVESIAPECGPTQPLVSRICRTIKNALDGVEEGGEQSGARALFHYCAARKARLIESPPRELPFTGAVRRLANWSGFSVELVVAGVNKVPNVENLYQACSTMRERCRLVQERLLVDYPELAGHA